MGNNHLALGLAQPSKCPGRGRTVTSSESPKWGVGRLDDGNATRPWSVLLIRPTVNVHNWNRCRLASAAKLLDFGPMRCKTRRDHRKPRDLARGAKGHSDARVATAYQVPRGPGEVFPLPLWGNPLDCLRRRRQMSGGRAQPRATSASLAVCIGHLYLLGAS